MQYIFGLSGQEEALAIKACSAEVEVGEMGDDELFDDDDNFNEQDQLDDMARAAGYGDIG